METAFERALNQLPYLGNNVELVGVCSDKPERKQEYENYLQKFDKNCKHIWIEQTVSMYSLDHNDFNPYEN